MLVTLLGIDVFLQPTTNVFVAVSIIALGLQALQSLTALQALEMMRSIIAPALQAL